MSNRDTTNSSTTPKPDGLAFLDEYSGHIAALYNASVLSLTDVSGADSITASVDPELPSGGLAAGMKFTVIWDQDNTGTATLNIDSTGAAGIVAKDGSALEAGQLEAGAMDLLEYDGSNFVLVTGGSDGASAARGRFIFETTGVFTNSYPAETLVMVEAWGAGGGGADEPTGGGGGGGSYQRAFFRSADLPSLVTVTIPAGGALESAGGDCTFGSLLKARGGSGGIVNTGGAGGLIGAGVGRSSGLFGGGAGGDIDTGPPVVAHDGSPGCWGGGGGGSKSGGGAASGGPSEFGGAGGDGDLAGAHPGGGGGLRGIGAKGRCIVTVF